jgi:hypothetical protein
LKEDLINRRREYNLPTNGSKGDLLEYIYCRIENKAIRKIKTKRTIFRTKNHEKV